MNEVLYSDLPTETSRWVFMRRYLFFVGSVTFETNSKLKVEHSSHFHALEVWNDGV